MHFNRKEMISEENALKCKMENRNISNIKQGQTDFCCCNINDTCRQLISMNAINVIVMFLHGSTNTVG